MANAKKNFWKYITLSILGMLGSSGTILADTFFISNRLGADGLAALNLSISVFGLMNGLGLLFGVGGATRYATFQSQKEDHRANQAFTRSFLLALFFGIALFTVGLLFSHPLAQALGANQEILPMCAVYLKTILLFAPCFLLNHLFMAFLRNDNNPKLAMAVMVVGSLSNIVLDYTLIYPLDMGMFGAALATGLSPVIGLGIASLHILTRKNHFHLVPTHMDVSRIAETAAPGLSSFVNELSSSIVLVVFNLLILRQAGNLGVAAYGIVANLALMVLAVFTGLSQGIQPLLSRAYGAGNMEEVRYLYRKGRFLALAIGVCVVSISLLATPALVSCFNGEHDPALQALAETGVRLYFIGFFFVGYNYLTAAFLSTTEQSKAACSLSIFRGCLGITGAACLLSALWGMLGIWMAFPVVELGTMALGLMVMAWRKKRLVPDMQPC